MLENYSYGSKTFDNIRRLYDEKTVQAVQVLYLISALLWLSLIIGLRLYHTNQVGLLILAIPLLVFAFGFYNSEGLSVEVEEYLYNANYLSVGLLIIFPLLTWCSNDYKGESNNKRKFITLVIISLVLTLFSLLDVWVNKEWISLIKHIKSVLQTSSLTLLIFALYIYYVEKINNI